MSRSRIGEHRLTSNEAGTRGLHTVAGVGASPLSKWNRLVGAPTVDEAPRPGGANSRPGYFRSTRALQTAPILIAVVTAYLATVAVQYAMASRKAVRGAGSGARPHP